VTQPDFIEMLINVSMSLSKVERMLFYLVYVMGLFILMDGVLSLSAFGAGRHGGSEGQMPSIVKILVGTAFIFLPSTIDVLSVSFFGTDAVLGYKPIKPIDEYTAIKALMQVAGIVWFIRGTLMSIRASEPGPSGFKSPLLPFAYMFAGIASINFDFTVDCLDIFIGGIRDFFTKIK
jgi:uncharacterized membrane protein HdeD (DUF308 family)